jgi:hypothetical protein
LGRGQGARENSVHLAGDDGQPSDLVNRVASGTGVWKSRAMFSLQFVVICLATLPIFTLGGYLTGNWKWKELGKKYPE